MRVRLLAGLIGVGLLLFGVLGCGNDDLFNLSGTAQNQETDTLLPNVNVTLLDSSGNQVGSTQTTNIGGAFSFINRPEGTYGFATSGPGLVRSFFAPFRLRNANFDDIVLDQLTQAQLEVIAPTATVPVNNTATIVAFGQDEFGNTTSVTVEAGAFGPTAADDPAVLTGVTPGTYTVRVSEETGGETQAFRIRVTANTVTIVRAIFINID